MSHPAYTVVGPALEGRVVWTCEHASGAVPDWVTCAPADRAWLRTHWGQDRGAAALTRAMQRRLGGPAILAGFSRLVADANRPPEHPDLCRTEVERAPFAMNVGLSAAARARRIAELHVPYHQAIDRVLRARARAGIPTLLFSVHAFTALYEGQPRTLDLGVLFDETDTGAAAELLDGLRAATGRSVGLNVPWSGLEGLVYSVARHGGDHDLPYLELEVRDDLLTGLDPGGPLDPVPEDTPAIERLADGLEAALTPVVRRWARRPAAP